MVEQSLNYITRRGLHDAVLNKCNIDYDEKAVYLEMLTEKGKINLKLSDVTLLIINMHDDFKNEEVILDFNVLGHSELKIFTTSNASYRIRFGNSEVLTDE